MKRYLRAASEVLLVWLIAAAICGVAYGLYLLSPWIIAAVVVALFFAACVSAAVEDE